MPTRRVMVTREEAFELATQMINGFAGSGFPVKFGSHSRYRKFDRSISADQILTVLKTGTVVDDREGKLGDTIWNMEGEVEDADTDATRVLRIGVVVQERRLFIVTAIWR